MKKLRKLKDGGAIGSGIGSAAAISSGIGKRLPKGLKNQVREGSVRPWIFDHSRRLRQTDLKRHEIQYMDLTKSETQLIRKKARPKRDGRTQELSGSKFHDGAYEDFMKSGPEMVSDDSDGTVDVRRELEGLKENPEVYVLGVGFFLLFWSLVFAFLLF
jgi:hypothetical protein